jgi:hypothetical protein
MFPFDSVTHKNEAEVVAQNIMAILARTGNRWRPLGWYEYKDERELDGLLTERERQYFEEVIDYCVVTDTAKLFSPVWRKVCESGS